jgi:hypothetical protein
MTLTRTEELTLSLARSARGRAGDGQILALVAAAFLAATQVRAQVDLGVVFVAACLLGVLSVLERRNIDGIIRKLRRTQPDLTGGPVAGGCSHPNRQQDPRKP